jgi:hypothetical protein
MTRAEDLLQALNGLQRAADSELSGDAREAASQYIKELFRFAGFDGEDAGEGRGEEAVPFAQALAEVRTQAEGELSGNAFELASIIFDDLASLSPSPASAPQEHAPEPPAPHCSEPARETPADPARAETALSTVSFNELGAASKARVEEVAANLGSEIARPSSPRPRSPAAPALVGVIEAGGQAPEYAAPHAEPALQAPVAAAPRVIVTKAEPRSASTERAATPVRPAKAIETAPKPQHHEPDRAFFNLWFDMMFGRKR